MIFGKLHCPCCGSLLHLEGSTTGVSQSHGYGVLRCGCYRYPVVEGIPILWQKSGPADICDAVVAHIDVGNYPAALRGALDRATDIGAVRDRWFSGRLIRVLADRLTGFAGSGRKSPPDGNLFAYLHATKTPTYADYLYQRFANVSLLAAIPLIGVLAQLLQEDAAHSGIGQGANPLILDLGCGIGHSSFLIHALLPGARIVATDYDFGNLLIARRYFAPNADYICIDAEVPLPFASDAFDAVFCMDAFHYLRSKKALVGELARVLSDKAIWLLPHLHNAAGRNISAGIPLDAAGYQQCFNGLPHRLLSETSVLKAFFDSGGIDLGLASGLDASPETDVFSMIGSNQAEVWRGYPSLDVALAAKVGSLMDINPIYAMVQRGDRLKLHLTWPNRQLEAECRAVENYLPRDKEASAKAIRTIRTGACDTPEKLGELAGLLRAFVLVPLPTGYPRSLV